MEQAIPTSPYDSNVVIRSASEIARQAGVICRPCEPLSRWTTFAMGGPAMIALPESEDGLVKLLRGWSQAEIPFRTIGNGSNLLVDDQPLSYPVLSLKKMSKRMDCRGNLVIASAPVLTSSLCRLARQNRLVGLEPFATFPASVGGAVRMNAGAYNQEIGELVETVEIRLANGERRVLRRRECRFSYRQSGFPPNSIIIEAVFRLSFGDLEKSGNALRKWRNHRNQTQPVNQKTAGCIFKNPSTWMPAGALIDKLGLKGFAIGDVQVSEKHANYFINRGNATLENVRSLIAEIREKAAAQGFDLDTEVEIWGASISTSAASAKD